MIEYFLGLNPVLGIVTILALIIIGAILFPKPVENVLEDLGNSNTMDGQVPDNGYGAKARIEDNIYVILIKSGLKKIKSRFKQYWTIVPF